MGLYFGCAFGPVFVKRLKMLTEKFTQMLLARLEFLFEDVCQNF